ncbi:hypothetical protein, partial [Paenibacillus jamilae]|uniref:hypothetical protein n=1 Tax=Paenibacillus jamilae TaxID=114136 RepID=UPI001E45CC06
AGLLKERLAHVETDEIKYLLFASISYNQMACTKISALDFVNKIRTHSLFSFQRSNLHNLSFRFVSSPHLSGDLNNIS